VLIYAPLALWRFHVATDAEIAQRYLDDDYEVFWVACRAELPICQSNLDNYKSICIACEHRSNEALEWLDKDGLHILPLKNISEEQLDSIDVIARGGWESIAELRGFKVDGSERNGC